MSSIKNVMASKYPSVKKEGLQSSGVALPVPPLPSYSWNNNKVLIVSIILGIVFLLVSLPKTYETTGSFFGFIDKGELIRYFPSKISFLHALVFTVLAFITIKIVNSM